MGRDHKARFQRHQPEAGTSQPRNLFGELHGPFGRRVSVPCESRGVFQFKRQVHSRENAYGGGLLWGRQYYAGPREQPLGIGHCLASDTALSGHAVQKLHEIGVDLKAFTECLAAYGPKPPTERVQGAPIKGRGDSRAGPSLKFVSGRQRHRGRLGSISVCFRRQLQRLKEILKWFGCSILPRWPSARRPRGGVRASYSRESSGCSAVRKKSFRRKGRKHFPRNGQQWQPQAQTSPVEERVCCCRPAAATHDLPRVRRHRRVPSA